MRARQGPLVGGLGEGEVGGRGRAWRDRGAHGGGEGGPVDADARERVDVLEPGEQRQAAVEALQEACPREAASPHTHTQWTHTLSGHTPAVLTRIGQPWAGPRCTHGDASAAQTTETSIAATAAAHARPGCPVSCRPGWPARRRPDNAGRAFMLAVAEPPRTVTIPSPHPVPQTHPTSARPSRTS